MAYAIKTEAQTKMKTSWSKLLHMSSIFSIYILFKDASGSTTSQPLAIFPGRSITASLGSNVSINCSLKTELDDKLLWHIPQEPQRERFHSIVHSDTLLELYIVGLMASDANVYVCASEHHGEVGARISVTENPNTASGQHNFPAQNRSGPCSSTQFQCDSGICIFNIYRCDNIVDCIPDAADERGCGERCKGKFRCDNGKCIDPRFHCDENHHHHCSDGSDEKGCEIEYTGQVQVHHQSNPDSVQRAHQSNWNFNAIYSAVAGIVGLVCVVAILVITVCRIHLQREALHRMSAAAAAHGARRRGMLSLTHGSRASLRLERERRCRAHHIANRLDSNGNVSLSINLRVLPSSTEFASLIMTPPPYSETGDPASDLGPPPYEPPPYTPVDGDPPPAPSDNENIEVAERQPLSLQEICCQDPSPAYTS